MKREKIINENIGLVKSIVNKFKHRGEYDDLLQVGCIGLIKAVDDFDESKGFQFSTYAVHKIRGEVQRYVRESNPIKFSRSIIDARSKVAQAQNMLNKNNANPTVSEIAKQAGLKEKEVFEVLESFKSPVSLSIPAPNTEGALLIDVIQDNRNDYEKITTNLDIVEALRELNESDRQILAMRYIEEKTQQDTAKALGCAQAQVSRLEKKAINRMKCILKQVS